MCCGTSTTCTFLQEDAKIGKWDYSPKWLFSDTKYPYRSPLSICSVETWTLWADCSQSMLCTWILRGQYPTFYPQMRQSMRATYSMLTPGSLRRTNRWLSMTSTRVGCGVLGEPREELGGVVVLCDPPPVVSAQPEMRGKSLAEQ